jgi:LPS export ABC transporter protein LptC
MKIGRTSVSLSDLRVLPVACAALFLLATACSEEKTEMVNRVVDDETAPTMVTHNVNTLISDSGITRYRMTAPIWLVYDEAKDPTWRFPEGMFLEKFDDKFAVDATVVCDSAIYFKDRGLWRLDGDVNIVNTQGEKFLTEQLFWDQRQGKVYSDSFVHIEKSDRIIEGYGFESNDRMTTYSLNKPSGIFPTSDFKGHPADSAAAAAPAQPTLPVVAAPTNQPPVHPGNPKTVPAPQQGAVKIDKKPMQPQGKLEKLPKNKTK